MQSDVRAFASLLIEDCSDTQSRHIWWLWPVLSVSTGLFRVNVDVIPGEKESPYAFNLFTVIHTIVGGILIMLGNLYVGLQHPISEELRAGFVVPGRHSCQGRARGGVCRQKHCLLPQPTWSPRTISLYSPEFGIIWWMFISFLIQ